VVSDCNAPGPHTKAGGMVGRETNKRGGRGRESKDNKSFSKMRSNCSSVVTMNIFSSSQSLTPVCDRQAKGCGHLHASYQPRSIGSPMGGNQARGKEALDATASFCAALAVWKLLSLRVSGRRTAKARGKDGVRTLQVPLVPCL
jgi:hypothetical protein